MWGSILAGVGKMFGGGGGGAGLGKIAGALGLGGSANKDVKRMGQGYLDAKEAVDPLYDSARGRLQPYADTGGQANSLVSSLLGLSPGNTSGAEAMNQFRDSTGYKDTMNQAMNGVSTNAAAKGLLGSSGTGKVFQNTAANIAQGSFGDFMTRLTGQQSMGVNAANNLAETDLSQAEFANENQLGLAETMAKKRNSSVLGKLFG
jgi:hypothetical protein